MLARHLRTTPRPLAEIKRLIEVYPAQWRRWCSTGMVERIARAIAAETVGRALAFSGE